MEFRKEYDSSTTGQDSDTPKTALSSSLSDGGSPSPTKNTTPAPLFTNTTTQVQQPFVPLPTTNNGNNNNGCSAEMVCDPPTMEEEDDCDRDRDHDQDDYDYENDTKFFASLPPGYRFCPTDSDLIIHYLKKKMDDDKLPRNQIRQVNLYDHSPEQLSEWYPPVGDKEWYFFTSRDRKYRNGDRPNRAAGVGYWKATGADKSIFDDKGLNVGFRKALVYYQGKPPKGLKTNWIMHEFRAVHGVEARPPVERRPRTGPTDMRLDKCVLCRIYKKSVKSDKSQQQQNVSCDPGNLYQNGYPMSSGPGCFNEESNAYASDHKEDYPSDHKDDFEQDFKDFDVSCGFTNNSSSDMHSIMDNYENIQLPAHHEPKPSSAYMSSLYAADIMSTRLNDGCLEIKPRPIPDAWTSALDLCDPIEDLDSLINYPSVNSFETATLHNPSISKVHLSEQPETEYSSK